MQDARETMENESWQAGEAPITKGWSALILLCIVLLNRGQLGLREVRRGHEHCLSKYRHLYVVLLVRPPHICMSLDYVLKPRLSP